MAAALKKAAAYSIYDMRRIENMLKNGVEGQDEKEPEALTQRGVQLRFLREGSSFNHYKNN